MILKKYKQQKSDDLSNKLKSYTAITGAFLLNVGAVSGQVIYTDVNPDTIFSNASFDIDFDHDGIKDAGIRQISSPYYHTKYAFLNWGPNPGRAVAVWTTLWFSPAFYPLNLPMGNPIGPGGPFQNFGGAGGLLARHAPSSFGGFSNYGRFLDTSAFIGVEFSSNGNTYYGWIECAIDDSVGMVQVKGYAYESTPNHYIIAGSGKTTGISEQPSAFTASTFYPNPVRQGKTFIEVDAQHFASLKFEIINGMGAVLKSEIRELNPGQNIIDLDVNSLSSGTYFVKLEEGENILFRKILVSR